jgi:hypothetical protein
MTSSPDCEIERLAGGPIRFSRTEPQISWLRIDYQARIQIGAAELVIETPFELNSIPITEAGLIPLLFSIPTRPRIF